MGYAISKQFSFEAAHYLPSHKGKCSRLHGHSYKGEVVVSAERLTQQGMVMDYYDLKHIIESEIVEVCDHYCLNEVLEENKILNEPTAEVLAKWFFMKVQRAIEKYTNNPFRKNRPITVESVVVNETSTSSAIYSRGKK